VESNLLNKLMIRLFAGYLFFILGFLNIDLML